ncbi:sigma-54-dependent Fis family transcriptional regulator [candidate division KSB1 bacterium]|nr:sigma-54-dependent Fis family transcriptional regulator [candidate division KSB1 bacterium]
MKSILIATNEKEQCDILRSFFRDDYLVEWAKDLSTTLKKFAQKRFEFLFIEIELLSKQPDFTDFKNALIPFWKLYPHIDIIVISSQKNIREAVRAVKAGAENYIIYPFHRDEVFHVIATIAEQHRINSELNYLRNEFWHGDSYGVFQTNSPLMKKVFGQIKAVAETESTVLLTGATGTGKGIIARLIHQQSFRNRKQFISVHCGAIPETLLESELFGHEKGAFTGAIRRKLGKFEIAHEGTIFLDEIGTIPQSMQIKLLQILHDRTFQRVGGEEILNADVRIIAATNEDLKKLCDEGTFRQDLFYRLNVFPIEIPQLKDRIEDIPLLVDFFLKKLNKLYSKNIHEVNPEVMHAFTEYEWLGNIRELENIIERAYILETSGVISPDSVPRELLINRIFHSVIVPDTSLTLGQIRKRELEKIEKAYLSELLKEKHGRIKATAEAAGIGVRQLHKLLCRHNISKNDFKPRDKVSGKSEIEIPDK